MLGVIEDTVCFLCATSDKNKNWNKSEPWQEGGVTVKFRTFIKDNQSFPKVPALKVMLTQRKTLNRQAGREAGKPSLGWSPSDLSHNGKAKLGAKAAFLIQSVSPVPQYYTQSDVTLYDIQ